MFGEDRCSYFGCTALYFFLSFFFAIGFHCSVVDSDALGQHSALLFLAGATKEESPKHRSKSQSLSILFSLCPAGFLDHIKRDCVNERNALESNLEYLAKSVTMMMSGVLVLYVF